MADPLDFAALRARTLRDYLTAYTYAFHGDLVKKVPQNRKVFVAYAYNLYPADDYRRIFRDLTKAFKVEFRFADEKITSLHIMGKIRDMIRESAFGIYDVSSWNPNVTLELGLAMGMEARFFIVFNPQKQDLSEVPSDIRGMDRLQYRSFSELEQRLASLLSQELPLPKEHEIVDQLTQLREDCVKLLDGNSGLRISEIAQALKVPTEMAKIIVRPLVDDGVVEKVGATKGAKYRIRLDARMAQV
jgi:hypothetical protein